MNFIELSVIYLACGAPFGVYFYFQERETQKLWQKFPKLWVKCALVTLFWLPFAIKLLQKFLVKNFSQANNERNSMDLLMLTYFDDFEKQFAQLLLEGNTEVSIFEFRETFQRFAGLTLEVSGETQNDSVEVNPLFQVTNHKNPQLATICLNRRNRLQLETHHRLARKDFLHLLEILNSALIDKQKLSLIAHQFAKIINDVELSKGISQIFEDSKQTENSFAVNKMENELWNPTKHKQQPITKTALNLPIISPRKMMSKQD